VHARGGAACTGHVLRAACCVALHTAKRILTYERSLSREGMVARKREREKDKLVYVFYAYTRHAYKAKPDVNDKDSINNIG
jgi:hypothetical protein